MAGVFFGDCLHFGRSAARHLERGRGRRRTQSSPTPHGAIRGELPHHDDCRCCHRASTDRRERRVDDVHLGVFRRISIDRRLRAGIDRGDPTLADQRHRD